MAEDRNKVDLLSQRLENIETSKASRDYVISEFTHLKDTISTLKDKVDEGHRCSSTGLIESIQSQVRDNSSSIKKIYTWQATVGISLLVFFLTIGVAALRFVDNINYAVQADSKRLDKIEKIMEERDRSDSDLKEFIERILQDRE